MLRPVEHVRDLLSKVRLSVWDAIGNSLWRTRDLPLGNAVRPLGAPCHDPLFLEKSPEKRHHSRVGGVRARVLICHRFPLGRSLQNERNSLCPWVA